MIDELPPDVRTLIATERSRGVGDDVRAEIRARLSVSTAGFPASVAAKSTKLAAGKLIPLVFGVAALGGGAWWATRPVTIATQPQQSSQPVQAHPSPQSIAEQRPVVIIAPPLPVVPPPQIKTPTKLRVAKTAPAPLEQPTNVGAEASLLSAATRSLRAGDTNLALVALDEHAAQFPHGVLAEERDALRIEVLLAAHQTIDARAAAAIFQRTYPHSVHERLLERATKETNP